MSWTPEVRAVSIDFGRSYGCVSTFAVCSCSKGTGAKRCTDRHQRSTSPAPRPKLRKCVPPRSSVIKMSDFGGIRQNCGALTCSQTLKTQTNHLCFQVQCKTFWFNKCVNNILIMISFETTYLVQLFWFQPYFFAQHVWVKTL